MNFSKTIVVAALVANLAALGGVSLLETGCSPAMKKAETVLITELLASCVAEHTEIQDVVALKSVCDYSDEFAPVVKKLLESRAKGVAKVSKMGSCPQVASQKDGGL